ncbi:DNA cytosine methyltransferase [Candidatus Woesearchaeota archaeon]|nr:DNA cytosine methyltransferase [Candidatus Woesearchaeota archaeon]
MSNNLSIQIQKNKPTVVSLFSGCGGLDLGFKNAGFEIIWANDFDKDSVETYKRNIDNRIVHGDITKISSSEIPKNADVLLGGFPCQSFSVANNKRDVKDKRNFLYKEMLRIIKDTQPKFFIAENVKGILSLGNGKVIDMIIKDFNSIGYKVEKPFIINCAYYGVPQFRERVIIMGNRINAPNTFPKITHKNGYKTPIPDFIKPEDYHNLPYVISVKEAIEHLPEPNTPEGKNIPNHIGSNKVSGKYVARKNEIDQAEICDYLKTWRTKAKITTHKIDEILGYRHTAGHWFRKDISGSIPSPKDWAKLKNILGFDNKYDRLVTEVEIRRIKFEQSLRVTNWDRPSDTITASVPEIHINKKRRLTARECAILQSFPNNFVFYGSLSSQHRQIGNAVPPLIGEHLAREIKKYIENTNPEKHWKELKMVNTTLIGGTYQY